MRALDFSFLPLLGQLLALLVIAAVFWFNSVASKTGSNRNLGLLTSDH